VTFREPVDTSADYGDILKERIDLSTVEKAIRKDNHKKSKQMLFADLMLMVNNCKLYSEEVILYVQCAVDLRVRERASCSQWANISDRQRHKGSNEGARRTKSKKQRRKRTRERKRASDRHIGSDSDAATEKVRERASVGEYIVHDDELGDEL
jgi:hypothetical protein